MKDMFNCLLFLLVLVLITGLLIVKVHKQLGAEERLAFEAKHKRTYSVQRTALKTQNALRSTQYDKIEIAGMGGDDGRIVIPAKAGNQNNKQGGE